MSMNANNLRAGRELDALIAKRITYDEWSHVELDETGDWYGWHIREGEILNDSSSTPATSYDPIPHYSTDNVAVNELKDTLSGRGYFIGITSGHNDGASFNCKIKRDEQIVSQASANIEALAICRAALQIPKARGN